MHLGERERRAIVDYKAMCAQNFRERGLRFKSSTDPDELLRVVSLAKGTNLTWTYHPDYSAVGPHHFWWSMLTEYDDERRVVAFNAQRMYETSDFIGDFELGMVFADGAPQLEFAPPTVINRENLPTLSGRVAIGGAMWTREDRRREGIYKIYSPLVQLLSFIKFRFDWYTAMFKMTEQHQALSTTGARFKRVEPFLEGEYAPLGHPHELSLAWKSGKELVEDIAQLMEA